MTHLLVLLALSASPALAGGKKKEAQALAAAAAEVDAVAALIAAGGADQPGLEGRLRTALGAQPTAQGLLVLAQLLILRSDVDPAGADAALRAAMLAPGADAVAPVLVETARAVALRWVYTSAEPETGVVSDAARTGALGLLDAARTCADQHGLTPTVVLIARVEVLFAANAPGSEQLAAVDAALQVAPDNVGLWLQAAALIENTGDHDAALERVQRALAIAPDDPTANYQAAVSYVNAAMDLHKQANELDDLDASMAMAERARALHQKARPHLEKVHAAIPQDTEALRQLLTLAIDAGDDEAAREYKAKLDALRGG